MGMKYDEVAEWLKCHDDVEYFIQNYVKLHTYRGIESPRTNPEMLRMIRFIVDDYERGVLRVDADRQVGKTTNMLIALLYIICFRQHKVVHVHTFKNEWAKEVFHKLRLMLDSLPEWMQPKLMFKYANQLEFDNGVHITASTSTSTARGRAIGIILVDEAAWCKNLEEFMMCAAPALMHKTGKLVLTSTDNPLSTWKNIPADVQMTIRYKETWT